MGTSRGKERADVALVRRGLSPSREKAQALIMAGLVYAGGERVEKPGHLVAAGAELSLLETLPYVGRGGLKLAEALDRFAVDVAGRTAADLGSSTGGFTDCLLQRGARRVYAVDVDCRQMDARLREDPRVVLVEKNARALAREDFEEIPSVVTLDLSFISVLKVLPALRSFVVDADIISLIKPQFEAGRRQVGKKGVVRDPEVHADVLRRVTAGADEIGLSLRTLMSCSTRGQKGNREFFAHWTPSGPSLGGEERESLIKEVVANA